MRLSVLRFLAVNHVICAVLLTSLWWIRDQSNDFLLAINWLAIHFYICFINLAFDWGLIGGKGIFRKIANIVIYICVYWRSFYMSAIIYSISSPDSRKLIQPEYVYPFIRFDRIYVCLIYTGGNVLKIVTVFMVRTFKNYRIFNVCLYIIYICIQAVIFVFILESLFSYAYKFTEYNIFKKTNFFIEIDAFGYEDNKRPLHYDELEHGRDMFATDVCKVSVKKALYDNKTLIVKTSMYDYNDEFYIQRIGAKESVHYDRQLGEDLSFSCKFKYYFYIQYLQAEKCEHLWIKNEQMVTNSDRYHSSINTELKLEEFNLTAFEYISVAMKLDIQILQKNDMGLYHCVLKCVNKLPLLEHRSYLMQTEYVINSYFVKELQPLITYQRAPVGTMVVLSSMVYHSATEHVSFEYLINNKNVDELSRELSCSLFVEFYFLYRYLKLNNDKIPYFLMERQENFHFMSGAFCNHGSHYGSHRLLLWRQFFNITKRKWELVEIPHYKTVVLLPDHTKSIFPFQNNYDEYDEIVEKIESGKLRDEIDSFILKMIKRFEDEHFLIFQWIALFISSIFIITVMYVLHKISCLYFYWTVRKAYLFILEGSMFRAICEKKTLADMDDQNKPYEFDFFISNTEEDITFVYETLVPFLEQKYRARICLIERDLPQGRTQLNALQWGISRSRRIIVVLSQNYIEDNYCNKMQLEHLILPDLYEGTRGPTDVLLLMIQQCEIPQAIRWNFDIEHIDWTSDASDRTKWDRLQRWASQLDT